VVKRVIPSEIAIPGRPVPLIPPAKCEFLTH
jgi:hypothetical protein